MRQPCPSLSLAPLLLQRCTAASSTRRTVPAEQSSLTAEPIIETAPLFSSASTTPPSCGCVEAAGQPFQPSTMP